MVEPGVLPIRQWRPDPGAEPVADVNTFGGIGRKEIGRKELASS